MEFSLRRPRANIEKNTIIIVPPMNKILEVVLKHSMLISWDSVH